jgi:hypothetical protein
MEGGLTYSRTAFDASLYANYIGGTSDTRTLPIGHVGSFTSLDATLRYKADGAIWPLRRDRDHSFASQHVERETSFNPELGSLVTAI